MVRQQWLKAISRSINDSLLVLRITRWLASRGLLPGIAACILTLRHQMCPQILPTCGSSEISVKGRSIGGLTGSRTAGLGRIPVESIVADRRNH